MKTKKEILIIIGIIIITITLVFLPMVINNTKTNDNEVETKEETNTITIKIYGEITFKPNNSIDDDEITNELSIDCKKGISYGEIINRINNYLTNYSIIDNDLTKRYYESKNILIKSSLNNLNEEKDDNEGKININTASLDMLVTLHGIGQKRAERIIDYIKANGNIKTFQELKSLIGVSDEIIELIKEKAFL